MSNDDRHEQHIVSICMKCIYMLLISLSFELVFNDFMIFYSVLNLNLKFSLKIQLASCASSFCNQSLGKCVFIVILCVLCVQPF